MYVYNYSIHKTFNTLQFFRKTNALESFVTHHLARPSERYQVDWCYIWCCSNRYVSVDSRFEWMRDGYSIFEFWNASAAARLPFHFHSASYLVFFSLHVGFPILSRVPYLFNAFPCDSIIVLERNHNACCNVYGLPIVTTLGVSSSALPRVGIPISR